LVRQARLCFAGGREAAVGLLKLPYRPTASFASLTTIRRLLPRMGATVNVPFG
jgi:hypothetical protein